MATDMRLSQRSKLSLCQFLEIFPFEQMRTLVMKHGMEADNWEWKNLSDNSANASQRSQSSNEVARVASHIAGIIRKSILAASDEQIAVLLGELLRTAGEEIRKIISPRSRYDKRWDDLLGCLELDGYVAKNEYGILLPQFVPIDPTIAGQEPIEDDLTKEIKAANLPDTAGILSCLENSTTAFRRTQDPDFNASLNNARVALESISRGIASMDADADNSNYDPDKWGSILIELKKKNIITKEQEVGLAGVYRFLSPGSHKPQTEREYVRMARHLAVSMAYFLLIKSRRE